MSTEHDMTVFSAANMFEGGRWEQLLESKLSSEEIHDRSNKLFGSILSSGEVTDIFMMEGWRGASGSVHEHEVSESLGPDVIAIHDLEPSPKSGD